MTRALFLLAAILFFRMLLSCKQRHSPTVSPYMNSLDGLLSPEQLSSVVDEISRFEKPFPRR